MANKKMKTKVSAQFKKKLKPKTKPKSIINKLKPTAKIVDKKSTVDYSKTIALLGERILGKIILNEKITAGGLIIPNSSAGVNHGYVRAKVLAVGPGLKNKLGILRPNQIILGDTIMFKEHSALKIEYKNDELCIINESDILGLVEAK